MEKVLGFFDKYKFQILLILVLILLWRVLSDNIILIFAIIVLAYFVIKESKPESETFYVLTNK